MRVRVSYMVHKVFFFVLRAKKVLITEGGNLYRGVHSRELGCMKMNRLLVGSHFQQSVVFPPFLYPRKLYENTKIRNATLGKVKESNERTPQKKVDFDCWTHSSPRKLPSPG